MIELKRPSEDIGTVYVNSDEAVTTETLPCRLLIPRVDTFAYDVSDVNYPLRSVPCNIEDHPVVAFAITADGFSSATGATHTATSYYIEDLEGNVVWKSEVNTIDLNLKYVEKIILPENRVFRIKVLFHSSTLDTSDAGIKTFIVKRKNYATKAFLENLIRERIMKPTPAKLNVIVPFELAVTELKLYIIEYDDTNKRTVLDLTVKPDKPEIEIDKNIFLDNRYYYIYYKTSQYVEGQGTVHDPNEIDDQDYWECLSFSTYTPVPIVNN